ncbi:arsenical-resistance protein ACR3 [Crepidotus variabilis]|uniref:Arsenical-resistance protein ACR3 n=1 Tax=Crepidotus variabilis TaxID=179855 RepID=A0A9P6JJ51_9AGAR|nr:arsenical-resistance protein ACR3 [Crepidotus variabilis]
MVVGVVIGEFAPGVQDALNSSKLHDVSLPIVIGLIIMMWPPLTKIQYESLPTLFSTSRLWKHLGISIVLNWIVGPLVMLSLAWATLPDLPGYRTGVILVGIARCIAMVVIWIDLARGHNEYGTILIVVNAFMQIVLFSPYSVLLINIIGGQKQAELRVSYSNVAISVLIYLGIPLIAGLATRFFVVVAFGKTFLNRRFLPLFGHLSLIGLLYTIIILFAYQGHKIIHNLGPVFRIFVPQILYFLIMWLGVFAAINYLSRRERPSEEGPRAYGYEMAVVQAFTAASNNFELAIAVAIAVYGVDSEQALAASIGPLTEVPVLLGLSWLALYLRNNLRWARREVLSVTKVDSDH